MARFMLLLHSTEEDRARWRAFTPEQAQQAMQRYYDWAAQLRREERMLGGDPLKDETIMVRLRDGEPFVDGPYAETKESVGGYFLIEARDLAEAGEVAKGCPALQHGGWVELREIDETEGTSDQ
jgi:hypothetical protein